MSEIPKGARVRITFEGAYEGAADGEHPHHVVRTPNGTTSYLSADGYTIEVLAPPLPPEPPVGATVRIKGHGPAHIWARYPMSANEGEWFAPGETGSYTWEQICAKGEPVRLYRADEQPQEKYEPATRSYANGEPLWLHYCGEVFNQPETVENPGVCPSCRGVGDWKRMYVREVESDG